MSMTAGCLGKIGYPSKKAAAHALARIKERREDKGADLKPYHCGKCSLHHLGRKGGRALNFVKRVPDHHRDSYQNRKARYEELVKP